MSTLTMALTRSMVSLLKYAALTTATLQPLEERVEAVKAPLVPRLAGDQKAEAVSAASSLAQSSSLSSVQQPASYLGALGRVVTCAPYLTDLVPAPPFFEKEERNLGPLCMRPCTRAT
ncbi:hypothetical protein ZWY2020_024514 [Hordeum vulgare]|nr:hypothetical protein ZWY2020_024514 [Hordeum vulgare]